MINHKGILLDIDGTIYNYVYCHKKAGEAVLEFAQSVIKVNNFNEAYILARESIHIELAETASSHNRLLYFQKTCEYLSLNPLIWAFKLYNMYWDTFLNSMELYDGVIEFLSEIVKMSKICFVTDLTAHIQYRKIEKFGLAKYVTSIVTSEEAGREKPHPYMFMLALKKLNMNAREVLMIGDNYVKDIMGGASVGIQSIWINTTSISEQYDTNLVMEIKNFKEILRLI